MVTTRQVTAPTLPLPLPRVLWFIVKPCIYICYCLPYRSGLLYGKYTVFTRPSNIVVGLHILFLSRGFRITINTNDAWNKLDVSKRTPTLETNIVGRC